MRNHGSSPLGVAQLCAIIPAAKMYLLKSAIGGASIALALAITFVVSSARMLHAHQQERPGPRIVSPAVTEDQKTPQEPAHSGPSRPGEVTPDVKKTGAFASAHDYVKKEKGIAIIVVKGELQNTSPRLIGEMFELKFLKGHTIKSRSFASDVTLPGSTAVFFVVGPLLRGPFNTSEAIEAVPKMAFQHEAWYLPQK